jgi:hypothetical protein
MKRLSIFLLLSLVTVSQGWSQNCKWEAEVRQRCKKDLKPFNYYAFKITKISFSAESQFKEIEVPLFHDANYRFVFNTEGLDQEIKIEIYDKPSSFAGRKKIYSGTSSEKHFVFDPPKSETHNRIYIDYIIPASDKPTSAGEALGCVIFYSGFKN